MASKSPTTFHNYWGSFAGAANLPNVAAAPTQDAALQAGDLAYESTGAMVYVCTNPALGAAVWAAVGAPDGSPADWVQKKLGVYIPVGNGSGGTSKTLLGGYHLSTGTEQARNVASGGTLFSSTRRLGYESAAAAGSTAGARHGADQFFRSSIAGLGGFRFICRFGLALLSGGENRAFVGLRVGAGVYGNFNPSASLDIFCMGADVGDGQWQIMHNDAAGAATKVALGAGMPFPGTVNQDFYEVELTCQPGIVASMDYAVRRLDTGAEVTGTVNADLPTADTLLSPQVWMNNGATASAVAIDVVGWYIETEN